MNYIFGYGSLICADSRSRTGIAGKALPIEVTGISRRWSMHTPEWPATAVSAHSEESAVSNGVYFKVDETNLQRFDEREQGYDRVQVPWVSVRAMSGDTLPEKGVLWAYVGKSNSTPSRDRPIMQSYVDVILNGCLDYNEAFATRFAQTTLHWDHLVDDRHNPQYPRALKSQERIPAIDAVLRKNLPTLLNRRILHNQSK